MKLHTSIFIIILALVYSAEETQFFDLTTETTIYSDSTGYGYDFKTKPQSAKNKAPAFFSIKVPDGNYKVTFEVGSDEFDSETTIRTENRRSLLENFFTRKGNIQTFSFVVHKRTPKIDDKTSVGLKDREKTSLVWDEKITFEFNGKTPSIKSLKLEPDTNAVTVFLCGDSTVVDQGSEPWASWGQIFPRWFDENVCIANYAESGETSTSFMGERRLNKILSMIKKGDYLFVEFGHNDEKNTGDNAGPYKNYAQNLKTFVDKAKEKGANAVILSPTARRSFEGGKASNTHGEYPEAAKKVAENEGVPFIPLTEKTMDLIESFGSKDSTKLYVYYDAGTYGDTAVKDNTHFNTFGAYEVAKCVVMGLKEINSPLVEHLNKDWKDFDPKNPDNPDEFVWAETPVH
jgi:lysophospholipase L1-like esterase